MAVPRPFILVSGYFLLVLSGAGCQGMQPAETRRLIQHQALLDFSGLGSVESVEALKITCAIPETWSKLAIQKNALYTHQQWRSPSHATGIGVVYIRLPLPLPSDTLVWMAKKEYAKKDEGGKIVGEWSDRFGRRWFEAENNKYHVRGYALADGADAWIIYSGYKLQMEPRLDELMLAGKSLESILPQSLAAKAAPHK